MKKYWLILIGLLGFVLILGRGLLHTAPQPTILTPGPNQRPPSFILPDLSGRQIQAGSVIGQQWTVVNFFASWCQPCHVEHDTLIKFASRLKHHPQTMQMLGIAYHDQVEAVEKWFDKSGSPFQTILFDHQGKAAIELGVRGVPETLVINPAGEIVWRWAGVLEDRHIDEIMALLGNIP